MDCKIDDILHAGAKAINCLSGKGSPHAECTCAHQPTRAQREPALRHGGASMIVLGVALLAACTLIGVYLGDVLGVVLGVKANV
ncbi:malonate transporter subunit MadL, partial [Roseovarius mucosus]|nr:malonate transporter subunit MadL [Roseovarius mucosus]